MGGGLCPLAKSRARGLARSPLGRSIEKLMVHLPARSWPFKFAGVIQTRSLIQVVEEEFSFL